MSTQACYSSFAPTPLVTTAETAVLTFTTPPYSEPAGEGIYFDINTIMATGTATTNITVRLRTGTGTAGPVVGNPQQTTVGAASTNQGAQASVLDQTPSYPQGQTYTVTVQQAAATGNGVMQQVTVSASPVVNSFTG
jgi:hypothetical protein